MSAPVTAVAAADLAGISAPLQAPIAATSALDNKPRLPSGPLAMIAEFVMVATYGGFSAETLFQQRPPPTPTQPGGRELQGHGRSRRRDRPWPVGRRKRGADLQGLA